ncbi:MAG TPA: condensation domain-containing protein [Mycobacteriales bacterium]|nr:condensation domain-containing protein [Mycobacteriales bacterium]
MAEHVLVTFAGEGSGRGELSWGQRGVWRTITADGEAKTMGGVVAIPGGSTVDKMAGSLRFVLGRHQSLRTKLRPRPDGTAGQEVFAGGELAMEIVDVPAGEDAGAVAAAVQRRLKTDPFDYANDWPVRAAAIRQDGLVTHAVVIYLHTSLDAQGLTVLIRDLSGHLAGVEPEPVTAMQPLELADRQGTPAVQRQSQASLRHMENVLRAVPAGAWTPTGADTDEHDTLYYWSPRLALAVAAVAERHGIDTSPVVLGAYALSLARETGVDPLAVQIAVSNRFRPRLAGTVAPLAQVAPCLLELSGTTLAGVVGRAWRGAMTAYKHAYYDPAGRSELVARLTAEIGPQADLFVFFNDRRGQDRVSTPVPDPVLLPSTLDGLRPRSTARWDLMAGPMLESLYLDVDDRDGALELTYTVDLRILSRAGAERVLRGAEDIAVAMALEPDAPSGVPARAAEPAVAR